MIWRFYYLLKLCCDENVSRLIWCSLSLFFFFCITFFAANLVAVNISTKFLVFSFDDCAQSTVNLRFLSRKQKFNQVKRDARSQKFEQILSLKIQLVWKFFIKRFQSQSLLDFKKIHKIHNVFSSTFFSFSSKNVFEIIVVVFRFFERCFFAHRVHASKQFKISSQSRIIFNNVMRQSERLLVD